MHFFRILIYYCLFFYLEILGTFYVISKKIFPIAPILLLTATCRMVDAQEIVTRLGIDHQKMLLVRDRSFGNNSIIYQVQKKKDNKEQFIGDILKIILNEIETGKCIIYFISIKECENLLTNLQSTVQKKEIIMYHGELSAKEKSNYGKQEKFE
jgi:superfamily II DNA helicase RecQ